MCRALIHPTDFANVRITMEINHAIHSQFTSRHKYLRMWFSCCNSPDSSSANWVIVLLTQCLFCGALAGCNGAPAPIIDTSSKAKESAADECLSKLNSAIGRMQPETMATQTRKESIAGGLNSWMSACVPEEDRRLSLSEANAALLTVSVQRAASQSRFTESDVNYIRDCLLLGQLTESLWEQSDEQSGGQVSSDLGRVQLLFQHVIRNVSPLKVNETRLPLGLYEVMLTGRGSVDERIWMLAEALRQRQIDTVLLKASTPGDPMATRIVDAADLLLLVILGEKALLFDPVRGTAVPKDEETSIVVLDPAEVTLIAETERWKSATPFIVANPSAFAPRMFLLQQRMEAQDAVTMYEELAGGTSEIHPLVQRLSAVLGSIWPAAAFKVWDLPEQQIAAAAALNEQQQEEYTLLMRPLDSPFERESISVGDALDDPAVNQEELSDEQRLQRRIMALEERWSRVSASSDELFGKPSKRLLLKRVSQISGSRDVEMIQDLQQIRQASMQTMIEVEVPVDGKRVSRTAIPLPDMIQYVQQSALGDTLYWTSMLQLSRNDVGAAISTLRNYRLQYPDGSNVFPSMMNEADVLIAHGNTADAIAVLKLADVEQNPEQVRAHWWLTRLVTAK